MEYNYWGGCWSHILIHKARGERHHPLTNVGFDVIFLPLRFNWVVFFTAAAASGWSFPFPFPALALGAFFSLGDFTLPFSFSNFALSSTIWNERSHSDPPSQLWTSNSFPEVSQSHPLIHIIKAILYFTAYLLSSFICSSRKSGQWRLQLELKLWWAQLWRAVRGRYGGGRGHQQVV